ncbi:MAG: hypothetical protein JWO78_2352 [Micavibrio sp.]|nr:hypothetical protein [Micavibrio sp.]
MGGFAPSPLEKPSGDRGRYLNFRINLDNLPGKLPVMRINPNGNLPDTVMNIVTAFCRGLAAGVECIFQPYGLFIIFQKLGQFHI